jgi:uncharacterized protein (DUF1800 family)
LRFDPSLAEIRFGYGLSPDLPAPGSVDDMLARLAGPDLAAEQIPLPGFATILKRMAMLESLRAKRRKSPGKERTEAITAALDKTRKEMRINQRVWLARHLARRAWTQDAFRERLVAFWADHFTARGKASPGRWAMTPHIETAIRGHVTGRFTDLLKSAIKAPLMLEYLDQQNSRGPGSRAAQRTPRNDGLNENLARELLELHSLGIDGPYGQEDVRQLAELLTGLSMSPTKGTLFRPNFAEPGAETVLGKRYGGGDPSMADIDAVLDDLARHPATALHIARKLAVHFVSADPDPALVTALATRFSDTGGDLMALYDVLLNHPGSWNPAPGNIRPPLDWVSAVVRALAVPADQLTPSASRRFFSRLPGELIRMGQPFERPPGPDGWPEDDDHWLSPQGLAARLQWAFAAPHRLRRDLPDPPPFAEAVLGPRLTDRIRFVASAAESRSDGIALILASPEFQRS